MHYLYMVNEWLMFQHIKNLADWAVVEHLAYHQVRLEENFSTSLFVLGIVVRLNEAP